MMQHDSHSCWRSRRCSWRRLRQGRGRRSAGRARRRQADDPGEASCGRRVSAMRVSTCASSLGIAVDGDTLYAASHEGVVHAISAADGRTRWRVETKLALSAGPGGGNGLVVARAPTMATSLRSKPRTDASAGRHGSAAKCSRRRWSRAIASSYARVDGRMRALAASDGQRALAGRGARAAALAARRGGTRGERGCRDLRVRHRQGGCGVARDRRSALAGAGQHAQRAHRARAAGRCRRGGARLGRRRLRRGLPGASGHAVARFGPGLVGTRRIELSRTRARRRPDLRVGCRRRRHRAQAPRRQRGVAAGRSPSARARHAGGGRVHGRGRRFRGLSALARSRHRPFVARERPGDTPIRTPVVGSGRLYALDVDGTLVAYTSSGADAAAGGV